MAVSGALAQARYDETTSVTRGVLEAVQGLWRDATPDRILSAMQGETGRQILNAVLAGQLSVAQGAQSFVTSVMMSQGAAFGPLGRLVPGSLAGLASDGRSLATLLYLPAVTSAQGIAAGMTAEDAAILGLNQMAKFVATTLADTSRAATSVAMAAEPRCVSYVRTVRLPACSRCIILAGRQYSYSEGFKRHPGCDCGMEPMSDEEWRKSASPEDLFKQMSPEQQDKAFGKAGADALRNGADIGQVVNARRGMATATNGKKVTTEGTTKRGIGGKALVRNGAELEKQAGKKYRRVGEARLMPEQILKNAHGDRELQIKLLKKHGYIV
jgi:hypothetical protein